MWILVLEGRMHDEPARRDVNTQGKREAAARHHVMSTDVERLMEVMCRAEFMTIRAQRKATTTVAAALVASDCPMRTNWPRPAVAAPPRRDEVWTFLKSARKNHA